MLPPLPGEKRCRHRRSSREHDGRSDDREPDGRRTRNTGVDALSLRLGQHFASRLAHAQKHNAAIAVRQPLKTWALPTANARVDPQTDPMRAAAFSVLVGCSSSAVPPPTELRIV